MLKLIIRGVIDLVVCLIDGCGHLYFMALQLSYCYGIMARSAKGMESLSPFLWVSGDAKDR